MRAIVISGATASGKSSLANSLAQYKEIAIINADSLQIYKGLPILSSQPSAQDKININHFLYSHLDFDKNYSVVQWLYDVKLAINKILDMKKVPVIVGGTGMYISKLFDGISYIPQIDSSIRNDARNLFDNSGREKFINILKDLGDDDAYKINDKQRLIRAYEVLRQTGKPIKYWQNQKQISIVDTTDFLHINLNPDRSLIYKNCDERFSKMLDSGAIEEVRALLNFQVDDCQISKTIGFKEIKLFLTNQLKKEDLILISSQKTRNYAKRQITWFKNQFKNIIFFNKSKEALDFIRKDF